MKTARAFVLILCAHARAVFYSVRIRCCTWRLKRRGVDLTNYFTGVELAHQAARRAFERALLIDPPGKEAARAAALRAFDAELERQRTERQALKPSRVT